MRVFITITLCFMTLCYLFGSLAICLTWGALAAAAVSATMPPIVIAVLNTLEIVWKPSMK